MKHIRLLLLIIALFATFCVGTDVPALGDGLVLDLNAALKLNDHGVVCTAVGAAVNPDRGIGLKVARGSRLTYNSRVVLAGKILFAGGMQLSKGARKIVINNISLDLKTGLITANVGGKQGVRFGSVIDVANVEAVKSAGQTQISIRLNHGLSVAASVLADIEAQLQLSSGWQEDIDLELEASISFDIDLAAGPKVNADLVAALRLDAVITPDAGLDHIRDLDFDVAVDLR